MRNIGAYYNHFYFAKFRQHRWPIKQLLAFVDRKEPAYSYLIKHSQPNSSLLDIGCGAGWFLKHAEKHFHCTGIDISSEALKTAKTQVKSARLKKLSIYELAKLKPNKYDVITCFDTLEHVVGHDLILGQVSDLLAPKGILVISAPNAASASKILKDKGWFGFKDPSHLWHLTPQQWSDRFVNAGFVPMRTWVNGLMDPPYFKNIPNFLQQVLIKYPTQAWSLLGLPLPVWAGETFFMVLVKNPGWNSTHMIEQTRALSHATKQ